MGVFYNGKMGVCQARVSYFVVCFLCLGVISYVASPNMQHDE